MVFMIQTMTVNSIRKKSLWKVTQQNGSGVWNSRNMKMTWKADRIFKISWEVLKDVSIQVIPGVNFTNIFCMRFFHESAFYCQNVTREKRFRTKNAHKKCLWNWHLMYIIFVFSSSDLNLLYDPGPMMNISQRPELLSNVNATQLKKKNLILFYFSFPIIVYLHQKRNL